MLVWQAVTLIPVVCLESWTGKCCPMLRACPWLLVWEDTDNLRGVQLEKNCLRGGCDGYISPFFVEIKGCCWSLLVWSYQNSASALDESMKPPNRLFPCLVLLMGLRSRWRSQVMRAAGTQALLKAGEVDRSLLVVWSCGEELAVANCVIACTGVYSFCFSLS